ncbi:unnamed protein product [Schistocephalus solidus]|uniref:Uncharacterized protein n=1 Tax=Schistocephalus solidus TaxID=70667 RepID=A0A183TCF0_SCHSO|nr:unnamed protein product [Schistocephalus solidus]
MWLRLQARRRSQSKRSPGKLNTALLNVPAHHLHFNNELTNRLVSLPVTDEDASVENRWYQLRDTVQSTALDVLGHAHLQHQDWFDYNDSAINAQLVEKNQLHKAYVDRPTTANKTGFYRREGHVNAPSVAALAAERACSHPEARSTGRAGDKGDPRCRPRNRSTTSNELANRLANLTVADMDIYVENSWCQLRDTIQSPALNVLGCAHRQNQDWFDYKDSLRRTS